MNLVIEDVGTPTKQYGGTGAFLPLWEYLMLSRQMIARFAPPNFRRAMLRSEDAIDYVAHKLMRADWEYDEGRKVKANTWRTYRGRKAIQHYLMRSCKADPDDPKVISHNHDRDQDLNPVLLRKGARPAKASPLAKDDPSNFEDREHEAYVIDKLLSLLTPKQRDCVTLHFLDQLTTQQIASQLGITRQGVEQNINRAMRWLRQNREVVHD
jgi:RNA polymerase sigma factor (sigma-70 family)